MLLSVSKYETVFRPKQCIASWKGRDEEANDVGVHFSLVTLDCSENRVFERKKCGKRELRIRNS